MADPIADPAVSWQHDGLAEDLARHLRSTGDRVVWCNIPLGQAGSIRPDCLAMDKSFASPRFTAYEVKVSRADFAGDVNAGKWRGYLQVAEAVYFAVPDGLVKRSQIPDDAGLMVRAAGGWRTLKAARRRPVEDFPEVVWQKLLIDGIQRVAEQLGREWLARAEERWQEVYAARERLGADFHRFLREREALEAELEGLRERAARARERWVKEEDDHQKAKARARSAAVAGVADALGLPLPENDWEIRSMVMARLSDLDGSRARKAALQAIQSSRLELERIARRLGADDPPADG